ncbi:hypothetical protein VNI00_011641 [Paramarasmius palmivorus]|uniref:PIN domain-like protein n=1 Tax=Paramarasmius palmivorus TaxID=297713 RepID=A0AAW0CEL3_9AGAR
MGVLGLTPFIQKTIPEAIKQLPDRLKGLSGQRIVIDGTLITQRLHFAQIPHPYRHVLGWYRILKELRQHGVEAVCVFDGKERNIAKAREALKRKEAQRLATAREVIERERLNRLQQLQGALRHFDWSNSTERSQLSALLQQISSHQLETTDDSVFDAKIETEETLPFPPFDLSDSLWQAGAVPVGPDDTSATAFSQNYRDEDPVWPSDPLDEEILAALSEGHGKPSPPKHIPDTTRTSTSTTPWVSKPAAAIPATPVPDEPLPFEEVSNLVSSLYGEYRKSIPKLTSVSQASRQDAGPSDADAEMAKVESEMSKNQQQLTLEEGKFWNTVSEPFGADIGDVDPSPSAMLEGLTQKSFVLSESYKRSSRPPTTKQYMESKELIKAMGVTCVDTEGAVEAEAVAASLVLNGYADYVASEDTDVLIYEAPLIRNITNRKEPLTVVSGAEVRSLLQLTREMYIDFALLLGTDFSQRIKNVGPARALKFIRTYGSIENIIQSETKYSPSVIPEYLQQVVAGRTVFQTLPPVPEAIFHREEPDEVKTNFLMGKYGLSSELEDYWEHALEGNYFNDNPSISFS